MQVKQFAMAGLLAVGLTLGGSCAAVWAADPTPTAGGGNENVSDGDFTVSDCQPGGGRSCPVTTQRAGGGTWNYGARYDPYKICYSHYVHNTKFHSATAIIHAQNVKQFAEARLFANADSGEDGAAYTCHAYWNTY